ncbi:ketopantoate reductase family protein [Halomicrobium salinisoli]|uniref:ketopantoate reductase family protein n=1 Tax=Halomicrobium salinisoli TaxID=2878391 RepID=UPI001CF0A1EB|nr:2-dehydropantoate 2-reductase [Halomicrobium salinisoli]
MKVAVFGAGGVGAYFGGRLAQAGADVHLIARGDHLAALREDGLRVESVDGDFELDLPATDDPEEVGACDYVLFCVKSFDTAAAAEQARPLVGEDTAVVSLQNGLDNEGKLAAELGEDHVMGGVAYIFSTIESPGVIEHTGGPAEIVFGELDGERSDRVEALLATCESAPGMEATLSENVESELWEKAALICAQAGMTATVRLPLGEIRETEPAWEMYQRLIEEVISVAAASGLDLPYDLREQWTSFAADLDPDSYSSLHYDMTHGKPMELEALHGAVLERAAEHGVDVPMTEAVYAVLSPWARRNAAGE